MTAEREILTMAEAADLLRLSRSTLYQRKDIPRHRLPGSRGIRFLRSELITWLRGERSNEPDSHAKPTLPLVISKRDEILETAARSVYHRKARYR